MTYEEYSLLEPGEIIRRRDGKRTLRIVVSRPGNTKRSRRCGPVGLVKVGRSWTDPNPCAWYDAWVIVQGYERTGRRGMSRGYAEGLRNWRRATQPGGPAR